MFRKRQILQKTGILLTLAVAQTFTSAGGLSEHRVMIPERGEVIGYMISVDTNHYSFLPPPGWRVSCKPGSKAVVMIASDLTTSITVDFLDNSTGTTRELLSSRYPEGLLRETFASFTRLGEAPAFDIERKAANSVRLISRVIYARQDWGVVEFALTAPSAEFADCTTSFANVVNSFHRPTR